MVAVPAAAVEAALADADATGVRAVFVLTSGFAETGVRGQVAEAALVRAARAHNIRLVGPDCIGVVNTDPAVRLAATLAASIPRRGGLAVPSESSAVGIAVLDHAARTGIGVSAFLRLAGQ